MPNANGNPENLVHFEPGNRAAERHGLFSLRPAERLDPPSQFLTVPEAADLLRARRQRGDDFLSAGVLGRWKEGR